MRAALVAALFAAATASAAEHLEVPRGSAPVIDGVLGADEWKGAKSVPLKGGGQALLKHDGAFVYIALQGNAPGIGSLCTTKNGRVRILHASAALGTAEFECTSPGWRNARGFTFTNRDTGASPAAMAERARFLASEGWFANSLAEARKEREYQIAIPDGATAMRIVLAFVEVDEPRVAHWPASTADGCTDVRLGQGYTDHTLMFDSMNWGLLTFLP